MCVSVFEHVCDKQTDRQTDGCVWFCEWQVGEDGCVCGGVSVVSVSVSQTGLTCAHIQILLLALHRIQSIQTPGLHQTPIYLGFCMHQWSCHSLQGWVLEQNQNL